ncbi:MAG: TRAP transporter fused permease subunit [Deltaproteobacteria bacterium]|nr:TRAP transporter fused permease subunit [Deltaproteobacteria bacterium]
MKNNFVLTIIVTVLALVMVLYHLISTQYLLLSTVAHLNAHLGFSLVIVFFGIALKKEGRIARTWSLSLGIIAIICALYVHFLWPELQDRAYFNTPIDLIVGVLLIFMALEAARQEFGYFLPVLSLVVMLYPFIGVHLPEPLHTQSMGLTRTIANLSIGLEGGVYALLSPSANYIFLFVVFGGFLEVTAGPNFLMELAKFAGSKLRGGPAMMAVVSSASVGSIIGSAAANVAITGGVTIPLMKKVGYKPEYAAGIEAAASNGGQIMPPIMGITAFAMAAVTGIPYIKIVAMAILPALLYFFCTGSYVFLRAGQLNIGTIEEKVDKKALFLTAPALLVPFVVIMVLLSIGYTVRYVAFWAILSAIVVAYLQKRTRPSLRQLIKGFAKGGRAGAAIGVTVACIGPVLTTFTGSGLGVKLSAGIAAWSGGNLFPALLIVWIVCIIMGMGGASLTAYLIVSIFAVPVMLKIGIPLDQAHFFTMFVAVFAFLTPPIALVAMVAAKMAGASYILSAIESTKAAISGFLLPFMFIYCPILILKSSGNPVFDLLGFIACVICVFALQVGFTGYYRTDCRVMERILLIVSAVLLLLFLPQQLSGTAGPLLFVAGIILFMTVTILHWRKSSIAVE